MDERMHAVRDRISALHAEAAAERAARDRPTPVEHPRGPGLRRRAGRALMALGELVEGRREVDCEPCPDGFVAARS
jgi:hypothetical protein